MPLLIEPRAWVLNSLRQRRVQRAVAAFGDVAGVAFGYLLVTLLVTYPLALNLGAMAVAGDPLLVAWALAWYAHVFPSPPELLLTGPIFHPYQFTMLFDEHLIAQAIQAWPVIVLTGNPILAYDVLVLSSFVLSAVGVYLLVRRWTDNRWAAVVAGALFAFSGVRLVHYSHLHILSVQWAVFSLWFLDRWLVEQRVRDLVGFIVTANLQLLSAYNFILIYPLTVAVWCVVRLLCLPRPPTLRVIVGLKVAAIAIALVNAPLGLLYLRLSEQYGFTRDAAETALYSAAPLDYLVASPVNWLVGSLTAPWRHAAWAEHSLFPGVTLLVFSVIGAAMLVLPVGRGQRGLIAAAVAVVVVLWNFSLGLATLPPPWPDVRIYGLLYDHVPVVRATRVPARAAVFVTLGLALLAGIALAWVLPRLGAWSPFQRAGRRLGLGGIAVAALLVAGIGVAESLSLPFYPVDQQRRVDRSSGYLGWLAAQPSRAPIVELPMLLHRNEQWYETVRMVNGTAHWRPLVNGYRGFTPPALRDLSHRMATFPDDETIAILRGIGVELVLVHRDELPPSQFEALVTRARARGLEPVATFETVVVYRVPEAPLASREQVSVEVEAPQQARAGESAEAWLILANADRAPFVPRIAEPYRVVAQWLADGQLIAERTVWVQQPLLVPPGDVAELPIMLAVPRHDGSLRLVLTAYGELAPIGVRAEQDYRVALR